MEVWRESGATLWRVFAPRRLWVASWTALGQLLGGSWRILGACWVAPGPSWAPGWGVRGRLEGSLEASWGKFNAKMEPSWHQSLIDHRSYAKLVQRLRTIIFPIDFNGFLRFRGSILGGKIDLGVSWRPLGASWRRLKASWTPLGPAKRRLAGSLRRQGTPRRSSWGG